MMVCHLLRHYLYVVCRFRQQGIYAGLLKGFWFYYERVHWILRAIPKLKGKAQFRKVVLTVVATIRLKKIGQKLSTVSTVKLHSTKDKMLRKLLQGCLASEENLIESTDIDMLTGLLSEDC